MGEKAVSAAALAALAAGLRKHDLDVGWAFETVLRSQAFFARATWGRAVLGRWSSSSAWRGVGGFDPPPSSLLLGEWATRLGQDLFYPPNVFGWRGGGPGSHPGHYWPGNYAAAWSR